uniref:Uncharacterized protein n=1 Tax=Phaeomonas parva TaxID=124430 RepID=A0A7S1XP39_9STRA|mmetsp:Transcript_21844/g.66999  ORF Transcript_21844/g.66999 Transcript_21844/m.66999 type:complete len:437 (+) Transcript_21844:159-1469(+)
MRAAVLPLLAALAGAAWGAEVGAKHLIVCDAGSTGTRLYVYSKEADGKLTGESLMKVKPGLSTFGPKPEEATSYLLPLFEDAMDHLDPAVHAETEVYIMATAGMRLIPAEQQTAVWDAVYYGLSTAGYDKFPFKIKRSSLSTITGETEGFYAALASNQLSGRISAEAKPEDCDDGDGQSEPEEHEHELLGALDLGGSSTQIVFPVEDDAGCEDDEPSLRGKGPSGPKALRRNDFWVHSYLGFGAEKASEKAWAFISQTFEEDPCSNPGVTREVAMKSLAGAGNGETCRDALGKMLFGAKADECEDHPGSSSCQVEGVPVPARAARVRFLAMSVYFYAMDCVRVLVAALETKQAQENLTPTGDERSALPSMSWPTPSLAEMEAVVDYFCAIPWDEGKLLWVKDDGSTVHDFTDADSLPDTCLRANYVIVLLGEVKTP